MSQGFNFFIQHFMKKRFREFQLKMVTGKAI